MVPHYTVHSTHISTFSSTDTETVDVSTTLQRDKNVLRGQSESGLREDTENSQSWSIERPATDPGPRQ